MAYRFNSSRSTIAVAFVGLSFTAAGCGDGEVTETGCTEDCYSTADEGCTEFGCYEDDGYYNPTSYTDDGPPPDTGYDEGYDEGYYDDDGYYPTTGYTDTTMTTITVTDTDPSTMTMTSFTESDSLSESATDTSTSTTTSTATDTDSGTETDTSTTGTSTGTTGDTDTDTSTGTTGDLEAFPPAGAFGDEEFGVQETDLVGTWSLQWAPDGSTGDSVITIDGNGEFIWRETSADCSVDTLATGFLWVEPGQLVMHVETWERQLPWDTVVPLGEEFAAPFRLRMTYALLGPNLGLAGPDRLTSEPYTGRAFLQEQAQGVFIAGNWSGEAELWAIPMGQQLAKVIVRDRFLGTLDVEPGVDPESTGIVLHDQVFWGADPPVKGPDIFENGNWTCLDGCPQPAGATLINGGNLYAYGPYAAYQRLMSFASGRSFKRDVDTDCP